MTSRVLLVDASSFLYRAFYAMPHLRNGLGEPTAVLQGVVTMLRRLERHYPASHKACVFDARGPGFREAIYPEYKAQRPSMPEEMAVQIEPLHQIIRALGWPLFVEPGVEADDVIGTLAVLGREAGFEVMIVTGDKDLTQLVGPGVFWLNTASGDKGGDECLDESGVMTKFGVRPDQIIDFLCLTGDKVDNIPGVPKCGAVTAGKWLAQYGNLENLIQNADSISGKIGESLRAHLAFFPTAKALATVNCALPLAVSIEDLQPAKPDIETLKTLYTRFELRTLRKELDSATPEPDHTAPSTDTQAKPLSSPEKLAYQTITDTAALTALVERLWTTPLVALDTETTSLDPMQARLVGISVSWAPGEAAYIPLAHRTEQPLPFEATLAALSPWLLSDTHKKLGQNLKYDAHVLANHGITLGGLEEDTLLESYVLESDKPHDLDRLALRHLGETLIAYADVCGSGAKAIGFDEVDLETATRYAAEDADVSLRLHQHLRPQLAANPDLERVYVQIEKPILPLLMAMERQGVLIDPASLSVQSAQLQGRIDALEAEVHEMAGTVFNLASPSQLAEILFEQQGLAPVKKTPGGKPSTDEKVLQTLALKHPLPRLILEHRSLSKLKNTYTDKLPRMILPSTGRIHTRFSQTTAITGRLSSSEPNLQNIPVRTPEGRRIRSAFIAPEGHVLVCADYSQIELRIMAHLSGDSGLCQAFAQHQDIHRATAAELFGMPPEAIGPEQRRYAKVINFGLIYGMSEFGLAEKLDISRESARAYRDRYFARYPGVKAYMERAREEAREKGHVQTLLGRRVPLPEIASRQASRRQGAERAAINGPMQGTAADLIKLAMISVSNWLRKTGLQSRLILQVHDELVLEVPLAELSTVLEGLPAQMENVIPLSVPLKVDLGHAPNWDEAH
jgi:DNA polymerase I